MSDRFCAFCVSNSQCSVCGIVFLKLIMELDPVTLFAQFSEAVAPRCDLLSLCELSSLELSVHFFVFPALAVFSRTSPWITFGLAFA